MPCTFGCKPTLRFWETAIRAEKHKTCQVCKWGQSKLRKLEGTNLLLFLEQDFFGFESSGGFCQLPSSLLQLLSQVSDALVSDVQLLVDGAHQPLLCFCFIQQAAHLVLQAVNVKMQTLYQFLQPREPNNLSRV